MSDAMFDLINSVQINGYTYKVADDITKTHDIDPVQVSTRVNQAEVSFQKKVSPVAIDHGETATLTYSIVNKSTVDISAATINDSLLLAHGVVASVLSGGTLQDGKVIVDLTNKIKPGDTMYVYVNLNATEAVHPSGSAYTTLATAAFTMDTPVQTSVIKNSSATFAINCAELKLTKVADALNGQILEGNSLTYTISIMNIGNVDATIPIGGLVDSWTADAIQNPRIRLAEVDGNAFNPSTFKLTSNGFSNVKSIVIPGQKVLTIKLSGNANIP